MTFIFAYWLSGVCNVKLRGPWLTSCSLVKCINSRSTNYLSLGFLIYIRLKYILSLTYTDLKQSQRSPDAVLSPLNVTQWPMRLETMRKLSPWRSETTLCVVRALGYKQFTTQCIINVLEITSLRQSFVIDLKDRITPMMVILFRIFSPPTSVY